MAPFGKKSHPKAPLLNLFHFNLWNDPVDIPSFISSQNFACGTEMKLPIGLKSGGGHIFQSPN